MWDLWWTKWHWDGFFFRVLRCPLPILTPLNTPYSSVIQGRYNWLTRGRRTKWTQSHPTLRIKERKTFPEGPAIGHLDICFLGLFLSQANAETVPKFQVTAAWFRMRPSRLKLIKIKRVRYKDQKICFQIMQLNVNSENKKFVVLVSIYCL
jgi:hypothetical protein